MQNKQKFEARVVGAKFEIPALGVKRKKGVFKVCSRL